MGCQILHLLERSYPARTRLRVGLGVQREHTILRFSQKRARVQRLLCFLGGRATTTTATTTTTPTKTTTNTTIVYDVILCSCISFPFYIPYNHTYLLSTQIANKSLIS